jgi:hypothetical protein
MRINEITEDIDDPEEKKKHTTIAKRGEILKFIQTNCSDAWDALALTNRHIYKGFRRRTDDAYITDASQMLRSSQNTGNFYTEFTSIYSQNWKQLPPRNRSLICTNNRSIAYGYGKVYYIFPENGTKIGICPDEDFWDSFMESGIGSMGDFADNMQDIMQALHFDIKKFLTVVIPHDAYPAFWKELAPFKGETVYEAVEKLLDPQKNRFKVLSTQQYYAQEQGRSNEVWFSGRAAMVREDIINDL